MFVWFVLEVACTALLLADGRDVLVGRLLDATFPLFVLVRVAGATVPWRDEDCALFAGRCAVEEVLLLFVCGRASAAGRVVLLFRPFAFVALLLTSFAVRSLLREVTALPRPALLVAPLLLRFTAALAVLRVLFADLTVAASATRVGRAEVRVLRSTSGR